MRLMEMLFQLDKIILRLILVLWEGVIICVLFVLFLLFEGRRDQDLISLLEKKSIYYKDKELKK